MRPLNSRFRSDFRSFKGWARPSFALAIGALGAVVISACGSSGGGGFASTSESNSTVVSVSTFTSTGTTRLSDGGVVTTTSTGTTSITTVVTHSSTPSASNSGSNSTTSGSGGVSTGTSGSGSSSAISDAGSAADAADGAFACTNTDMTKINIDSSGWACNNKWGIQGAWYCYADTAGTSSCTGEGFIPFNATSNAMCISGTTSTSTSGATAFGAGIGLVLNQPMHGNDAKNPFNATAQNIVGFAITVSGNTGGSVLNINFPPALTTTGESAAVTVPAVAGTTTTFNALIANAIISDNNTAPVPKIDATKLTDVQVALPGADGVAHTYNFCITSIVPLTAAPAAPGSLTGYGASFNEGKQIVLEGLGAYGVQNDPFGVGTDPMSMTVSYGNGEAAFTASPTFGDTGNTPGAFPSIVAGWVHGGNYVSGASGGYAGGKTIGSLASAKSNWSYTAGSGKWDAAYDVWFAGNPAPISAGSELMVWLGHNGVNPIGGQNTAVTVTGAPGSWTVSTGTNGTGQPVVSYVATTNMTSVTGLDLLPFFKEAANSGRAGLSTGSDLLSVQAGFELYQAGTWTTSSYSIAIQ